MTYKNIVSLTGFSGLFELINSRKDGAVVRSLEDKQTKFVSARLHALTQIESIEIYTTQGNVNLVEIFKAMQTGTASLPNEKDNAALKAYFQKIYPSIDLNRVYVSDMKKMITWFTILQENKIDYNTAISKEEEIIEQPAIEKKESKEIKDHATTNKPKKTATKKGSDSKIKDSVPKKPTTRKKKVED